jgi:hypothetical protein
VHTWFKEMMKILYRYLYEQYRMTGLLWQHQNKTLVKILYGRLLLSYEHMQIVLVSEI